MTDTTLISISIFVYFASWLFYLAHIVFRTKRIGGIIGDVLALTGVFLQVGAVVSRWVASHRIGMGHAPLSNLYESMVFFSITIVVIYLVVTLKIKTRLLGAVVMPIAFLTVASTSLTNRDIQPLVPALQSNWLTAHVITCFLGYGAFAVAFGVSVLYLLKARYGTGTGSNEPGKSYVAMLPGAAFLDEWTYKLIAFGFPLLTLGIITGAAWANSAWGSYWTWDPKETWSLIVWLIYAAYLHARTARGWKGKRSAMLSIFGFIATLFCYLGVNLLLSGLHSYASG